ncbi:MAG TPA: hypothetical protein VL400_01320 [Polyangiaceae bacterium]|jgi:hypothetical protein|nr:hypothetical protein [Polyangiaceae bacterium]
MKLGWLLVAAALSAPLAAGCLAVKKPVVLAPAPAPLKQVKFAIEGATDRLGPETTTALTHALTAAGFVVTQGSSEEPDAILRVKASGEEVQSVMQTYVDGQLQRTFHVTGSITVLRGGKVVTTVPIDFECTNGLVADADVNGVVNTFGRDPLVMALSLQLKFDRELEAHKNDAPLPDASASTSAAASSHGTPKPER